MSILLRVVAECPGVVVGPVKPERWLRSKAGVLDGSGRVSGETRWLREGWRY